MTDFPRDSCTSGWSGFPSRMASKNAGIEPAPKCTVLPCQPSVQVHRQSSKVAYSGVFSMNTMRLIVFLEMLRRLTNLPVHARAKSSDTRRIIATAIQRRIVVLIWRPALRTLSDFSSESSNRVFQA